MHRNVGVGTGTHKTRPKILSLPLVEAEQGSARTVPSGTQTTATRHCRNIMMTNVIRYVGALVHKGRCCVPDLNNFSVLKQNVALRSLCAYPNWATPQTEKFERITALKPNKKGGNVN